MSLWTAQYPTYSKYTRLIVCMRLVRNNCNRHHLTLFPVQGQGTLVTMNPRTKVGLLLNHFGRAIARALGKASLKIGLC